VASGKQSRRRRQQARVGAPPTAGTRRASPKVLIAAAGAVALVAAAVGIALALSGGSSSPSTEVPERGSLVNALPGARDVQQLLAGIPQNGNVLGSPSAPVTLIEYVDLQCPYCAEVERQVIATLVSQYVESGQLKIEMRPVAFFGPDSVRGRDAAVAAGNQDRMFNLLAILFANQGTEGSGWLDDDMVTAAAASIPGLAVPKLLDEMDSNSVADTTAELDSLAQSDGIQGTPTILVGKTGQPPSLVVLRSTDDTQSVAAAIEQALR
jgi:protein-disulfide isomerase